MMASNIPIPSTPIITLNTAHLEYKLYHSIDIIKQQAGVEERREKIV